MCINPLNPFIVREYKPFKFLKQAINSLCEKPKNINILVFGLIFKSKSITEFCQ
jgi:hypothetical protein